MANEPDTTNASGTVGDATLEAAAYQRWLAQEIQAVIDDPQPSVPHEEVAARWAVTRALLLARADRSAG